MRASVFVPGHISCVFRPYRAASVEETGSRGLGIRLSLGCRTSASRRNDERISIRINGQESEASVTRYALESMGLETGLDIDIYHDLPMEQGFGTSASGTYAAALCGAELCGRDRSEAILATHKAECDMGGGLGDLLAIESPYPVPVREHEGVPGLTGRTEDSGITFDRLTLIVFERPLSTKSVLGDPTVMDRIIRAGDSAMEEFMQDRSKESLFRVSESFSADIGLESEEVSLGIEELSDRGYHAGMCMLGNSIFSDAPISEAEQIFGSARIYECSSFSGDIRVSRTE